MSRIVLQAQICAFHANFAAATQHGGSSRSARTNTLNHTQSALSPSAFYVTGKSFNQNTHKRALGLCS
jgi:hypothetical protein